MSYVVKILNDEDGTKIDRPGWCYVMTMYDSHRTLCSGQVFGYGEGRAKYLTREGRVTCRDCLKIIKEIKNIKY